MFCAEEIKSVIGSSAALSFLVESERDFVEYAEFYLILWVLEGCMVCSPLEGNRKVLQNQKKLLNKKLHNLKMIKIFQLLQS